MVKNLTYKQSILALLLIHFLLSLPGLWVPYYNIDELTNGIFAFFLNDNQMGLSDFLGSPYLLTHYLYKWVYAAFPNASLLPIHVFHSLWKACTVLSFVWAGRALAGKKAGLWAGLFYAVFSTCFMSKDFHTPSAESFSLLPATLCAGFVFQAIDRQSLKSYFFAGVFAGLSTLCKAPMGVTIVAINLMILVRGQNWFKKALSANLVFIVVLLLPTLLVTPFGHGFVLMFNKVSSTNFKYIQSHGDSGDLYFLFKYFFRTGLIGFCSLPMTAFALFALRKVFRFREREKDYWQKEFFLFVWLCFIWFTVAIGKRVFYHYYVFLFAPLPLLAAAGVHNFEYHLAEFKHKSKGLYVKGLCFLKKRMVVFLIILPLIAFVDGALNFSTKPNDVNDMVAYIKDNTKTSDRIYVWGNVPQLYFFSKRWPSTTHYWSDILAGTTPGSPAMEYVRATGKTLSVQEALMMDMQDKFVDRIKPRSHKILNGLTPINESEFFTIGELLDRIDHPYWRKVFHDFLKRPPELFIDSSGANIRGFGFYPIHKYELLKRYVLDNYELETSINKMDVYRLKNLEIRL